MIDLEQDVEIMLNPQNIKHYEERGYNLKSLRRVRKIGQGLQIPKGTKIFVKAKHLPRGSHTEILITCDYCEKELKKVYKEYIIQSKSIIKKDCCSDCNIEKTKDVLMKKYGRSQSIKPCTFEEIKTIYEDKGYELLSTEYNKASVKLDYICKKHRNKGVQKISPINIKHSGCYYCGIESNSGENHFNWNGGTSNIRPALFNSLTDWKNESMSKSNYKCVLTQDVFTNIHHLHPFTNIITEVFKFLNIKYEKEINNYTTEQMELIKNKCKILHKFYGLGVCLCKPLHTLYHNQYGFSGSNQQFSEFVIRLESGEFNPYLTEHNLTLNINHKVLSELLL